MLFAERFIPIVLAPGDAARLLVIEPDDSVYAASAALLARYGYELSRVVSAVDARVELRTRSFDLILMEIQLPGEDGLSLCRELATAGYSAIIIYSTRIDPLDRVAGLEFGADDYLDKGCHPLELLARVRASLRRTGPARRSAERSATSETCYVFDNWIFDLSNGSLVHPHGRQAWLKAGERGTLTVLLQYPQEVLARERMHSLLFGASPQLGDRAVDVRIVRLRRKLNACAPRGGDLIRTMWGRGYLLNATITRRPERSVVEAALPVWPNRQ
jgi:two-component system OmpR family response regulator